MNCVRVRTYLYRIRIKYKCVSFHSNINRHFSFILHLTFISLILFSSSSFFFLFLLYFYNCLEKVSDAVGLTANGLGSAIKVNWILPGVCMRDVEPPNWLGNGRKDGRCIARIFVTLYSTSNTSPVFSLSLISPYKKYLLKSI